MSVENRILPKPQSFEYLDSGDIVLGKFGKAMFQMETVSLPDDPLIKSAVKLLRDHIADILNTDNFQTIGAFSIRLTIGKAPSEVKNPEQAYSLEVTPEAVILTGFGVIGLYYGVITLNQCLKLEQNILKLPCMRILDWPDLKTRGHFMESRFGTNLMTLVDWKHVVDHMANMKMNQLVVAVYGCWGVQYDGRVSEYLYIPIKKYLELKTPVVTRYFSPIACAWIDNEKLPPMFEQDFLGELIAYGKTRGITVFPLFNSFGHNTLIPATYPGVSAKDENGEATLTGFCTRNPQTYEILFSIYDEIIDRYLVPNGIDSFHIGLDEVWDGISLHSNDIYKIRSPWCKCNSCKDLNRKDIFISHAIMLLKYLKSRGMKNIYMYHDMLIGHGNSIADESCEDMMKELKDNDLLDVVIIDWWTYAAHKEDLMFQTTRPDLGLRRTVKPWNGYYHWALLTNPLANIYLLAQMGIDEGVEGMQSYSSWDESYDRNHFFQADYSWNFVGSGSIEHVNDHYIRYNFGAQYEKARRAFKLIDYISEDRKDKYEEGTLVISNYNLLLQTLSYYFYSYVEAGKPYPRIFPGEAMSIVHSRRNDIERALYEIACMAKEAVVLLDEVSLDTHCNIKIAMRYAYEVNNYLCLVEDYLALLRMMDISASSCPDKLEKIKEMACTRKRARLKLMTQLEWTKEHFLLASHMRNQSIFMQFFADLEGYIESNDIAEIELDFFDMRYLESDAFKKLR